jgi:hypothetical protein
LCGSKEALGEAAVPRTRVLGLERWGNAVPFNTALERKRFVGRRSPEVIEPNVPDEQHPKRMSKADSAFETFAQDKGRYACDGREQLAEERRHQQVLAVYYNIARQLADRIDSCEHKPSCWSRNEPVGV